MKNCFLLFLLLIKILFAQNESNSISLSEAVEISLTYNLEMQNANKELEKAYKEKWKTISIGLPEITSSFVYQNYIELPTSLVPAEFFGGKSGEFAEINFGTEQTANASIKLNQLIFDGTYIIGLQGIKLFLDVAQNVKKKTEQYVKSSVISAYTNLLLSKENLKILRLNSSNLKQNISETRELFENGFIEEESLEQLKLTYNEIMSQLNYAEELEKIFGQMLNFIVGFDLESKVILTDSLEGLALKSSDKNEFINNFDIENNLDFKIALNNVYEKKLFYRLEKAKSLPSISAFYNAGYTGNSNSFTFTEKNQKWFSSSLFGLKVDFPIFSSLGRSASSQKAKLTLDQAQLSLEIAEKNINLKYQKIKTEYYMQLEKYFTSKENLELAERIERKNQIKFFEGLSGSFDLRQAQLQLYSAQSTYLNSMKNLINKKYELELIINESL